MVGLIKSHVEGQELILITTKPQDGFATKTIPSSFISQFEEIKNKKYPLLN